MKLLIPPYSYSFTHHFTLWTLPCLMHITQSSTFHHVCMYGMIGYTFSRRFICYLFHFITVCLSVVYVVFICMLQCSEHTDMPSESIYFASYLLSMRFTPYYMNFPFFTPSASFFSTTIASQIIIFVLPHSHDY